MVLLKREGKNDGNFHHWDWDDPHPPRLKFLIFYLNPSLINSTVIKKSNSILITLGKEIFLPFPLEISKIS